ncbi:MAG: hypothetical protein HOM21_17210, partial [Halobacteriovoraceae bacterium]|nr:hypothetical protein [Halobacteriovoraceae bacterium]
MFGFLDFLHYRINEEEIIDEINDPIMFHSFSKKIYNFEGDQQWLIFSGWNMPHRKTELLGFLPKNGKVMVYAGPMSIVGKTPMESKEAMDGLEKDIEKTLSFLGMDSRNLNVLGFSAGTYPAFYFANKYRAKKFVAISPGGRMGEGMFKSEIAQECRRWAEKLGFSPESFDEILKDYNQENNLKKLPMNQIQIFGGWFDRYVRNGDTRKLVKKIKNVGKNPVFKNYLMLDHISLIMWLGFKNRLGLDPYQLKRQPKT